MIKYSLLFLILASSCISEPKKKTITDSKIINSTDSAQIKKEEESMNDSNYIVKKDKVSYLNDNKDLNNSKINISNELIGSNELFKLLDNSLSYFENWCKKKEMILFINGKEYDDSSIIYSYESNYHLDKNFILSKIVDKDDVRSKYLLYSTQNIEEYVNVQSELSDSGFHKKRAVRNGEVEMSYINNEYFIIARLDKSTNMYTFFIALNDEMKNNQ